MVKRESGLILNLDGKGILGLLESMERRGRLLRLRKEKMRPGEMILMLMLMLTVMRMIARA